ncbi:unnamed protein product [Lepidochelys kempii]
MGKEDFVLLPNEPVPQKAESSEPGEVQPIFVQEAQAQEWERCGTLRQAELPGSCFPCLPRVKRGLLNGCQPPRVKLSGLARNDTVPMLHPCGCPCTTQPQEGMACLLNEKLVLCTQAESWPGQAVDSSSKRRMGEEPRYFPGGVLAPRLAWWRAHCQESHRPSEDMAVGSKQTTRPKEG